MVAYFFTNQATTHLLMSHVDQTVHFSEWQAPYGEVIPYLRHNFQDVVKEISRHIDPPELASRLAVVIRELCDPDPNLRGPRRKQRKARQSIFITTVYFSVRPVGPPSAIWGILVSDSLGDRRDRRIVPRWRASAKMIELKEASRLYKGIPRRNEVAHRVEILKKAFESTPSMHLATELVGAAIVARRSTGALAAAEYVSNDGTATGASRRIALKLLGIESHDPTVTPDTYCRIAGLRNDLRSDPRDSLRWLDFAHAYINVGQLSKASHALNVALSLNPDERLILRSATRFFFGILEMHSELTT